MTGKWWGDVLGCGAQRPPGPISTTHTTKSLPRSTSRMRLSPAAYLDADPGGQAMLAATADTFAAIALVTKRCGQLSRLGVVVPLYAVAILTARALPRWIG